MRSEIFNCQKAKEIDLVSYLNKLGYSPVKITNLNVWYLSPFRNEKTASFKVNRNKKIWFDFAEGKGGTIIDFEIRYYKCSIQEFLLKLSQETGISFSFPQPILENKIDSGKILISDCRPIADPTLRQYLHESNIPLIIANRFCSEIEFELYGKKHLAIPRVFPLLTMVQWIFPCLRGLFVSFLFKPSMITLKRPLPIASS